MQDQRKRLLLVVALMVGMFLVWKVLARPDDPVKQAQTTSEPGSAAGSATAPAPGGHPAVAPDGAAGGSSAGQPVPAQFTAISFPAGTPYAQRFAILCAACH